MKYVKAVADRTASEPILPEVTRRPSPMRGLAIVGLGLLLAVVGVGAFLLGRDSAGTDDLNVQLSSAKADLRESTSQVSSLDAENGDLEASASDLESANADLDDKVADLKERVADLKESVAAANGLAGDSAVSGSASAPDGSKQMGVAAQVGELLLRPTSLEKSGSYYVVTIVAKNDGSASKSIFCGGSGASLTDTGGRTFDGDSILADNTANCGDDLQPGLTATYQMRFKVPDSAEPAYVSLWDDSNWDTGAEESVNWAS